MNHSIAHQDAAGMSGAPLAVFHNGVLLAVVPDNDSHAIAEQVAREHGISGGWEVLTVCHIHPQVAAVDCTDCVPLDEED